MLSATLTGKMTKGFLQLAAKKKKKVSTLGRKGRAFKLKHRVVFDPQDRKWNCDAIVPDESK